MKSCFRHLTFVFALLLSLALCGAEAVFPVMALKQAPGDAADWDAAVWQDVPVASGFHGLKVRQFAPRRQTLFKMGWHGDALYVLVKCLEPDMENIRTDKNNYRDGWYPDDHLEYFVCNNRNAETKSYKQFVVNSIGGRWCNFTNDGKSLDWSATASKEKNAWTVLMRIPFAVISQNGIKGPFFFNLARTVNGNTDKDEVLTCFAPVVGGFGKMADFIPMEMVGPDAAKPGEAFRTQFDRLEKWSRARLWKMAFVREAFLADRASDPAIKPVLEIKQKAKEVLKSKDKVAGLLLISEYERLVSSLARPRRKSPVQVVAKNASVKLFLDGKEVPVDAKGNAEIAVDEGFSVLGAECAATGPNPGVKIRLLACPETDGRWKAASNVTDRKWMEASFSDASWKVPASKDAFMWAEEDAKKACLRQILLFNAAHDGPNRCINPLVKEWGFSVASVEPLFLMLNPPLPGLAVDYEYVLDLPEGFRLMDLKHLKETGWWGPKVKINCNPQSVTTASVAHDGKKYTRYVIRFAPENISAVTTFPCILPVALDESRKPGESLHFYYFRRIAGNFTELEQRLPVRILPRVNGRMPPHFRISMYCSMPYFGADFSHEALVAFVNLASDAGFNAWTTGGNITKTPYFMLMMKTIRERGATATGHYFNYPAWRGSILWGTSLRTFVENTPEAKARYFNDFPAVVGVKTDLSKLQKDWNRSAMYCPTYVTGKGRELFVSMVANDIKKLMAGLDGLDTAYWINWESEPWQNGNTYVRARSGMGSYCFCDKCKADFVQSIGLPKGTQISDEEIFSKHYDAWAQFRYRKDGEIQGLIRQAVNSIGRKYSVYSWITQEPFWEACKGRVDIPFPGCPGNAPADAAYQPMMDRAAKFLQDKAGFSQVVGQRFSFFGPYYSQGSMGWKSYSVMSNSGYVEAKTWKPQILRIAATMHGGVDLQSSLECVAGMMYYIGEASRAITEFEDIFMNGKRNDGLAVSSDIKYPNLLVLARDNERLVLLFNEGAKPQTVTFENKNLKPGQKARVWEGETALNAAKMTVTIPANDVVLVHIK